MLIRVKTTLKHTGIYGLGNIATKLIGVVLLPLYTKHITVAEYGILGILEITILILTRVLIFGQGQAFVRFYDLDDYLPKRKSTLFTVVIFVATIGIIFNLFGQTLAPVVSTYFHKPAQFTVYFQLCFYIILLRIVNELFLSVLRAKQKSAIYAVGNAVKFLIVLVFNIYFVAFAKLGVVGILYSYLIGDALLVIVLLPMMISEMSAKFELSLLKQMLIFGFPLIFNSLASMILNMGNRYILKLLVNYEEVGLYNLGYKVAGVLNMLFIQSFALSLLPIAYKMYGQLGDKRYYSKMLTYFVFIICWAGLGLSVFGEDLIKFLALSPDYYAAYQIVPMLVLAFILHGAKTVTNIGLLLKKKTNYIAYKTIGAAILNIILNFILIPKYKMMGAAMATAISFAALYVVTYYLANRFYRIPYENIKLIKMLIVAVVLFFISGLTTEFNIEIRLLAKLILIILFPLLLYPLNFYEKIELERLKEIFYKLKSGYYFKKF